MEQEEVESNEDLTCSYVNALGHELNDCEDLPVTYCRKCRKFYFVSADGTREEIVRLMGGETFE